MNKCVTSVTYTTPYTQNQSFIDSLSKILTSDAFNQKKADACLKIAREYVFSDSLNTIKYTNQAIQLAKEINYWEGVIDAQYMVGVLNSIRGNYIISENIFKHIIKKASSIHYLAGKARGLNGLGIIADYQGNYVKALDCHFQSLKIKQALGDIKGMAKSYNNIANIYNTQGDYTKSLNYHFKSLEKEKKLGNKKGISESFDNIGKVYQGLGDFTKALDYHFKALDINEKLRYKKGIISNYKNIGTTYYKLVNLEKALNYSIKSLKLSQSTFNQGEIAASLYLIGLVYQKQARAVLAKKYLSKALSLSQTIGISEQIRDIAQALSLVEKTLGDYQAAYEAQVLFKQMADSLQNENQIKKITRLEAVYEFQQEKDSIYFSTKTQQIALKKDIENRKITQVSTFIGLGLLTVLLLISFLFLQSKRKSNELLIQKSKQLEIFNKQLNIQNRKINASLKAAQSIQQAFFTYETKLADLFEDYFLINLPKDVVSGDFYWIEQINDQTIIVVADCTGHGVPGAFMTLIGDNLLDKIIKAGKETDPAKILEKLHLEVQSSLQQKITGNNKGMDAVVVTIERDDTNASLTFAGAKNGLLVWSNQQLNELKGSRKAIGGIQDVKARFVNHSQILRKGDILYLGSDGLRDQNNKARKSLGEEKLKILTSKIATLPLATQRAKIESMLFNHMQDTEQRDDILWIGVKI